MLPGIQSDPLVHVIYANAVAFRGVVHKLPVLPDVV